jgi:hypothetical protein
MCQFAIPPRHRHRRGIALSRIRVVRDVEAGLQDAAGVGPFPVPDQFGLNLAVGCHVYGRLVVPRWICRHRHRRTRSLDRGAAFRHPSFSAIALIPPTHLAERSLLLPESHSSCHRQSFAFRYPACSACASLANVTRFLSLIVAAARQFGL